jgi:hypothetical protein
VIRKTIKILLSMFLVPVFAVPVFYIGRGYFLGARTISQLLTENKELKRAVTSLTAEDQIGYAKVISQRTEQGQLFTTIKFVETARDNKLEKIIEKEYTVQGDIVHFDALIVKFSDKMVLDGKAKSLYLWRRIYGEKTAPDQGFAIEQQGGEPERYRDILAKLHIRERKLFWENIWSLANDNEKLRDHGITAIYGNVVYSRVRPGLIYVFKISATGQVWPEVVPDI